MAPSQTFPWPDSQVHGANMGPVWGRQDPGGPQVGPMNFVIWVNFLQTRYTENRYCDYCIGIHSLIE